MLNAGIIVAGLLSRHLAFRRYLWCEETVYSATWLCNDIYTNDTWPINEPSGLVTLISLDLRSTGFGVQGKGRWRRG